MIRFREPERIGRRPYWIRFGASLVVTAISAIVAALNLFSGQFGLLLVASVAIAVSGIYLRLTVMQRCRDIGWNPMLPWYFVGAGFVLSLLAFFVGQLTMMAPVLGATVAAVDFIVSVIIGCLPSKDGTLMTVQGSQSEAARSDQQESVDDAASRYTRHDDSIAQAISERQPAVPRRQAGAMAPIAPRPATRVSGFGKKRVGA